MTKTKLDNSLSSVVSSLPDYMSDTKIIPTNIYMLDYILNGGMETGSFVQLIAESGLGKSTIALQIAYNYCETGEKVVYVDTESSVSNEILELTGVAEFINQSFMAPESSSRYIYIYIYLYSAVE